MFPLGHALPPAQKESPGTLIHSRGKNASGRLVPIELSMSQLGSLARCTKGKSPALNEGGAGLLPVPLSQRGTDVGRNAAHYPPGFDGPTFSRPEARIGLTPTALGSLTDRPKKTPPRAGLVKPPWCGTELFIHTERNRLARVAGSAVLGFLFHKQHPAMVRLGGATALRASLGRRFIKAPCSKV